MGAEKCATFPRRDFLRTAGGIATASVLGAAGGCSRLLRGISGGRGPFFFIQMSDPQFGMFSGNKDFEKETDLFEKAIAHANRLRPRFVVVTGDLINEPGNEEQAGELRRIAGRLKRGIPLHWVAGNHDVESVPTPKSLAWLRKTLGPDWYAFDQGGCRFIVLNSCLIQQPANAPYEAERQMEWLRRDLEATRGRDCRHIIVFMHHPVCLTSRGEEDGYFALPRKARIPFLDLLHKYEVSAVFSGHCHRNAYCTDGDLELVATGPVGKPLGDDPSGFRIVEVYADRLKHKYCGFDDVPERVELGERRAAA
jgi:3',5'-cyclic AMP phosphodiesterase CpdA